jgi:hypothetical protein
VRLVLRVPFLKLPAFSVEKSLSEFFEFCNENQVGFTKVFTPEIDPSLLPCPATGSN